MFWVATHRFMQQSRCHFSHHMWGRLCYPALSPSGQWQPLITQMTRLKRAEQKKDRIFQPRHRGLSHLWLLQAQRGADWPPELCLLECEHGWGGVDCCWRDLWFRSGVHKLWPHFLQYQAKSGHQKVTNFWHTTHSRQWAHTHAAAAYVTWIFPLHSVIQLAGGRGRLLSASSDFKQEGCLCKSIQGRQCYQFGCSFHETHERVPSSVLLHKVVNSVRLNLTGSYSHRKLGWSDRWSHM